MQHQKGRQMENKHTGTNESTFSGHRGRLRREFITNGADSMKDRELLELLLTYAIPRADVAPRARELLSTFGSLEKVFCASPERLMSVDGIGEAAAVFISTVGAATQRICVRRYQPEAGGGRIETAEHAAGLALALFMAETYECVRILCLDSRQRILSIRILAGGDLTSVRSDPRLIMEQALVQKAASVVLIHNHPSGEALPSETDNKTAQKLFSLGEELSVPVLDQLIVGHGAVYSFRCKRVFVFSGEDNYTDMSPEEYEKTL